jgi:MFS family permease
MVSSFLGTTVEFYDFLLYGTAASLVFPVLFFKDMPPLAASFASFGTLAVGYFARPVGGVLFGHFGDRLGRRRILVITLFVMGTVSFLIGLLPTAQQIGVAAPLILVTLRVVQGLAVGGEWAGAALMSMEHAHESRRGFAASIVASGGPSGAVLATIVLTVFSLLPEQQFLSWGWRVPFLLSAVLVVVGLFLRLRVTESPAFLEAQARAEAEAKARGGASVNAPIIEVLRNHAGSVVTSILGGLAPLFMQSILATFMLTYAVGLGHARTEALLLVTVANFLHIFTIAGFAALSDRIGRKPVMVAGAIAGVVLIWPIFWLVGQGSAWALLAAFVLGNPLVQGMMYGPMAAWVAEKFPTSARYTGVSVSYQLATTLGAGLAPLVATALLAAGGGTSPVYIIGLFAGLCVLAGIVYLTSKETSGAELAHTSNEITGDERIDLLPATDSLPRV